ncbi:hypothetical protein SUGI_0612260 [Cryptomeria japonica]|uniref:uncharacterized protein LOC131037435 n=1 Tax=Cryptomeria japonica TaxID=3369 RepID=UPI002414B6A6|nr:uncharacterized protein LOC131037435 [Cryptomeria japonica]GLJ30829.1 hypothetical protein SUGI_0612260 [Cryptomeria japonica]
MEGKRLQPKHGDVKGTYSHSSSGRSKRDVKQTLEGPSIGNTDGIHDIVIQDSKHRRRTQDPVPIEDALQETDIKFEQETSKKGSDPKIHEASKPKHVPNAGSFFQHDDRSAVQNNRNVRRRFSEHGGWNDSVKGHPSDRYRDRANHVDSQGRDNRGHMLAKEEGKDRVWRHDRFFELEASEPHETRKPAFTETKMVSRFVGSGSKSAVANDNEDGYGKITDGKRREGRGAVSEWQNEGKRGSKNFVEIEQKNKDRDHVQQNEDLERGRWLERDQRDDEFQNRGRFNSISRGRDMMGRGLNGTVRNQLRPHAFTGEKWKHDLFDEANRSPPLKNEEEQIAKIELLLSG